MIYHGFAPQAFICANIIPIPKGSKASLTSSDKYRSIAISKCDWQNSRSCHN